MYLYGVSRVQGVSIWCIRSPTCVSILWCIKSLGFIRSPGCICQVGNGPITFTQSYTFLVSGCIIVM